jgi:hypothetical protein
MKFPASLLHSCLLYFWIRPSGSWFRFYPLVPPIITIGELPQVIRNKARGYINGWRSHGAKNKLKNTRG